MLIVVKDKNQMKGSIKNSNLWEELFSFEREFDYNIFMETAEEVLVIDTESMECETCLLRFYIKVFLN